MREPISITLSERALEKLDELVKLSNLESRSRTIEEIILALNQIIHSYSQFVALATVKGAEARFDIEKMEIFLNQLQVILDRLEIATYVHKKLGKEVDIENLKVSKR